LAAFVSARLCFISSVGVPALLCVLCRGQPAPDLARIEVRDYLCHVFPGNFRAIKDSINVDGIASSSDFIAESDRLLSRVKPKW